MNYTFYVVFTWFFYFLVEVREFEMTNAGFITSAQWIAGGAGAVIGGWSFAISSATIFSLIGAALVLLVRADRQLSQ